MIDQFKDKKVLVIGDIIIDEYVYGDVTRISAEAPIPVFTYKSSEYRLGGAANVATNINSLGGTAWLTGIVNMYDVDTGKLIRDNGITSVNVVYSFERKTTHKQRFISQGHQMFRADYEVTNDICSDDENAVIEMIKFIDTMDAIVISDYAKGVVTKAVYDAAWKQADKLSIPLIVAPKPKNLRHCRLAGVYCINEKEHDEIRRQLGLREILAPYGICLIVTKGKNGAELYSYDRSKNYPAHEVQVADTTGAGDTFLAAFTLAYLASGDAGKAVNVAIAAAGIAVTKFGTATVSAEELKKVLT